MNHAATQDCGRNNDEAHGIFLHHAFIVSPLTIVLCVRTQCYGSSSRLCNGILEEAVMEYNDACFIISIVQRDLAIATTIRKDMTRYRIIPFTYSTIVGS